jgi:hypothetical protein
MSIRMMRLVETGMLGERRIRRPVGIYVDECRPTSARWNPAERCFIGGRIRQLTEKASMDFGVRRTRRQPAPR